VTDERKAELESYRYAAPEIQLELVKGWLEELSDYDVEWEEMEQLGIELAEQRDMME
jgi:hypothetical protein